MTAGHDRRPGPEKPVSEMDGEERAALVRGIRAELHTFDRSKRRRRIRQGRSSHTRAPRRACSPPICCLTKAVEIWKPPVDSAAAAGESATRHQARWATLRDVNDPDVFFWHTIGVIPASSGWHLQWFGDGADEAPSPIPSPRGSIKSRLTRQGSGPGWQLSVSSPAIRDGSIPARPRSSRKRRTAISPQE
jgi:hypothetical protein